MGLEWKLPNWHVSVLPLWWSFCLVRILSNGAVLPAPTGQPWERGFKSLLGPSFMLLPLPSRFCKQVRDYGMQKQQPEVLPIYAKMLCTKGAIQASHKFTLILCWEFFCLWLWTPWQPGSATLPVNPAFCDLGTEQGGIWLAGKLWSRKKTPSTELAGIRQMSNKKFSSAPTTNKWWT